MVVPRVRARRAKSCWEVARDGDTGRCTRVGGHVEYDESLVTIGRKEITKYGIKHGVSPSCHAGEYRRMVSRNNGDWCIRCP
jgi:hypothetical protein